MRFAPLISDLLILFSSLPSAIGRVVHDDPGRHESVNKLWFVHLNTVEMVTVILGDRQQILVELIPLRHDDHTDFCRPTKFSSESVIFQTPWVDDASLSIKALCAKNHHTPSVLVQEGGKCVFVPRSNIVKTSLLWNVGSRLFLPG